MSSDPTAAAKQPTTTTTEPVTRWDAAELDSVAESAVARIATGPMGLLVALSEDSFQPPVLWFSTNGEEWSRVAEQLGDMNAGPT